MTAPSNANTSGLVAEIDAEMEGRQRGYADVRGELLFRCRDALVTAASAQARIAELEAELSQANANGASHWSRATAAEARADRLAKALMTARDYVSDAAEGHAWTASQVAELMRGNRPDNRQADDDLASIDAALQQETQP